MRDYNERLHAQQETIRKARELVYSQKQGELIAWDPAELEWLMAAIYKLLRVLQHTKDRGKAMDDLVDAANYVGLLYDRMHEKGARPTTSEEILGAFLKAAADARPPEDHADGKH